MMNYEIPRDLQMPYLRAIQKIPGDTVGEKWSWIGRLASCQSSKDLEQLPTELLPILRVEIANKKKNHEDITSALKCEDSTVINRALKASWFFDGSHKKIVDVAYFSERLFPYVSVNVRTRIVITLAHRLAGKDPIFAQQMFTAVSSIYDIQTAYPLIVACDEAFVYKTIVEKELVLPVEIASKIFRKNPDLIVRFLKLLKPKELNATERTPFAIGIDRYKSFLPKLIKKRLEAFVELCEIHETCPPKIVLSNTCAEIFLKKAQHLIRKPLLYIHILPPKKINEHLMESIFPNLLPVEISSFDIDKMLDYLKLYPRDKKYDLLRKSYKNKYCAELLDETKNVTSTLLQLLPAEERIKQARIKIEKQNLKNNREFTTDYKQVWICYLPVNEVVPVLKEKINKTANDLERLVLIKQMMYVCKINEDDEALSNTLTYFLNRHKNENSWFFGQIFGVLLEMYDVSHLNKKQVSLVLDIVRLVYVKYKFVTNIDELLTAIVHFKLIRHMPIEELLDMLVENAQRPTSFNILKKYPQYERHCLETFGNIIRKKYFKDLDKKRNIFYSFVGAIYNFNDRCKTSRIKIEKMTIRDYPWLMKFILEMASSEGYPENFWGVRNILKKNESELYQSWFPENIADVTSNAALALLNRDLQSILNNWEKYLVDCMNNYHSKCVQRFVKATRWYKDLPTLFANRCMDYIYDKNTDKISSSIVILAILLHSDIMTEIFDLFIPTETTVDTSDPKAQDNYKIVQNLSLSIRLSNPPVPLDLIVRLCKGDYLSIALMTLTNVSRRTSLPKVISIAQELMSMRISTRKHGIRLMKLVTSERQLIDFLQKTWATESHHSIREVLFKAFQNVFFKKPNPETWSLYYQATSTLTLNDEDLLSKMHRLLLKIPNVYIAKYFELWLKTIDDLEGMGLDIHETNRYKYNYLSALTTSVFDLLSEEFAKNILQRFLFHIDIDVSEPANRFALSYILSEDKDKCAVRIKIFADVFHNTVTTYWNVPHPKNLRFYPVNKAVYLFIDDFVTNYIEKSCFDKSIDPEIIDNMQTIFLSALSPRQNARSYLMLVYAKKLQECTSTKTSFGLRLGQQLQELIDVFSSLLIPFMADILYFFLNCVSEHFDLAEMKLNIIEGFVEAGNTNSYFMAVSLLPSKIQTKHVARYDRLIEKFREMEEPVITVFYNYLNKTKLEIID